jgi:hypothetical protein
MSHLVPKDGESQPDFAIRFHQSAMTDIPNTAERNRQCFEAWRSHVGDEPEVAEARRYHRSSDFLERRDIPVFEEHEVPARKSRDGRTIPAVKYDRKALASICRNMNEQIADVGKFCPITNGHTSDNRTDPEPEVLGYTGAYRLGMIGNTKPRYAIFADEYHRKDRDELLKGRRGRSVEVLPLPDVHKRSFYPIAALGADEPRLNLPPARYFNRPSEHGEDVEVERYMMVAPGGNGTFVPSDDRDKYGDEEELPSGLIKSIMEAFMNSAMGQYLVQKMEEDGKAGSPNPLVHQAPQMADMPAEDGNQPGQPGMPGEDPMGQPQLGGFPQDAGSDMGAGAPPQMPPKPDAGGPMNKLPFNKGTNPMATEDKEQYSKSAGLQALEARIVALEAENAGMKAKLIGSERYSKLAKLKSDGFEFDVQGELSRVSTQSDEQFTQHCETIEKYYRKSPAAVADFSAIAGVGKQGELPETGNGVDELTAADVDGVMKYARKHDVDYVTARERYCADKKSGKSTAG